MAITFEQVKRQIDPLVGKMKTVTVSNTSTQIGEEFKVTDGIVIYRTGIVDIKSINETLTIRLEGGIAGYKNGLFQQHVYATYTRAQYTILESIISYISTMNPNVIIEKNL